MAAGVTPTAKTPDALVSAVTTLKQQAYADGAAKPSDRAFRINGQIVDDGRGTYQGIMITFPNGKQLRVHNQEYATWYLSQMI